MNHPVAYLWLSLSRLSPSLLIILSLSGHNMIYSVYWGNHTFVVTHWSVLLNVREYVLWVSQKVFVVWVQQNRIYDNNSIALHCLHIAHLAILCDLWVWWFITHSWVKSRRNGLTVSRFSKNFTFNLQSTIY